MRTDLGLDPAAAQPRAPSQRRRLFRISLRQQEALAGYVAISPWMLGFLVFAAGPMAASLVLVFMKWEVITPPQFVGLNNFTKFFQDPLVGKALYNTAFYTLFAVPLHLLSALGAAMLLNVGVRGSNIYRSLMYLPSQMPAVASAILWFFVFSPTYGLANAVLGWFGIAPQKWLWDVDLVKPALVLMAVWSLGNTMIIFLAGLQGISETLYEAAKIDGANSWDVFRNITLPMLSPTIFFNLILSIIGSFQVFTSAFVMTGGGPGNSSLFLVLYIYRHGFQNFNMGYASLLAWLLFCIVLVMTFIQFRVSRRWVFYEGEVR